MERVDDATIPVVIEGASGTHLHAVMSGWARSYIALEAPVSAARRRIESVTQSSRSAVLEIRRAGVAKAAIQVIYLPFG